MLGYTRRRYDVDWENLKILRNNSQTFMYQHPGREGEWYSRKVDVVDLLGLHSERTYYPGACAWFHRLRSLWNPPIDGDYSRKYYYEKYKDVMLYDMLPELGACALGTITNMHWYALLSRYGRRDDA